VLGEKGSGEETDGEERGYRRQQTAHGWHRAIRAFLPLHCPTGLPRM
jgi:hypothetical protein